MRFPVVIHKDPLSDYGVTVPDLPGCFSAGSTLDEALVNAVEAIELHLEGMVAENETVPHPGKIDDYRTHPDFVDGIYKLVSVDLAKLKKEHRASLHHAISAGRD